jgi:hypothetical protein
MHAKLTLAPLSESPGHLQHPLADRLPLRRGRRHAGLRVVPRIRVLPSWHAAGVGADICPARRVESEAVLF